MKLVFAANGFRKEILQQALDQDKRGPMSEIQQWSRMLEYNTRTSVSLQTDHESLTMMDCTETRKTIWDVGMILSHNHKLVDLWFSLFPAASHNALVFFYIFSYNYVAYDDFVLT